MRLHDLPKIVDKKAKRLGRGMGSGKGKTSGRGMKGQKARSKIKSGFEGGQLPLLKRLPILRGWRFKSHKDKPQIVAVERLNIFPAGSQVTPQLLVEKGIIKRVGRGGVKILANGKLKKKLTLRGIKVSRGVREQIEELGGKVI